jgi:hypothetical protein
MSILTEKVGSKVIVTEDGRETELFWDYKRIFDVGLSSRAIAVRVCLVSLRHGKSCDLDTVAQKCKLNKPAVMKALRELEDKGLLEHRDGTYLIKKPPETFAYNLPACEEERSKSPETGHLQNSSSPFIKKSSKAKRENNCSISPSSSPEITENSESSNLTNKDIISALGDAFLAVPGMAERYDGPQKKRVYALMGRLYHRLDCEPVYQAIDALKKRAGAVDDPLRFVAGIAEKCAQKDKERKMGEEEYYAALRKKVDRALQRVGGNADLLNAEERKWVKDLNAYDWYQAVKANGEKWRREHPDYRERMKQYYEERKKANEELRRREEEKRQKEREQLLMLIYQPEPSDPALKQIADAQREIAQKELEKLDSLDIFLPDGKKVKHIATIAEDLLKGASA